jgi:hypothetical protein
MKDGGDKREGQAGAPAKNSGKPSTGKSSIGKPSTGKPSRQDARQDRLKLALRENLKRRKSQARGRSDLTSAPSNADDTAPYDDGGKASE